jgi:type II secretory pathway pseudopilin PulG
MIMINPKSNKGMTMVEAVIAVIVAAVASAAIFSVLFSTTVSEKKVDSREEAAVILKKASEMLKMYVSEDTSLIPVAYRSGLCGGDSTPMSAGDHTIDCLLDNSILNTPRSFTYTVTDIADCAGSGMTCKKVSFDITYADEPSSAPE